jgi:predicted Zn-dependent peptidase
MRTTSGDLSDLDAATLDDAASFFKTYYAPNNAALVVTGDFDPKEARRWITNWFGGIASVPQPAKPDISEPRQEREKRETRSDPLASRPAIGFAYHVPPRYTPSGSLRPPRPDTRPRA